MKKVIGSILILIGTAACHDPNAAPTCTGMETVTDPTGQPTVMVIGDSISIGYFPAIKAALVNRDVVHNPCNAMDSGWSAQHIDQWMTSRTSFEAITWNNGLWDVASWGPSSDAQYEANLHYIATALKAKSSKIIFVLTTQVLPGTDYRNNADVLAKNAVAIAVMASEGIPVVDLYTVSTTIQSEHVNPTDVHYTDAGYGVLGAAVLGGLNSIGEN